MIVKRKTLKCSTDETAPLVIGTGHWEGTAVHHSTAICLARRTESNGGNTAAISHADFYRLNSQMDNWRNFYQRILEMAYSFQNGKIEQRVTLTAKQRYEVILNENPALVQQVSNKILASYLDIREETLSRLKSK